MLFVARPVAIGLVLRRTVVSKRARTFIGWFGPRGLSSLLFGLLVVLQGVPGAERLLAITGVVATTSVILHGVSATPLIAAYGRAMAKETLPEEREMTATGLFGGDYEAGAAGHARGVDRGARRFQPAHRARRAYPLDDRAR